MGTAIQRCILRRMNKPVHRFDQTEAGTPFRSRGDASTASVYPWFVWGVGAAFFFYSFFQRVTPSVMFADLMRDFAVGGAVFGVLSGLYFYAYAALQLPVGILIDRGGPRRVLTAAAALAGLGSLIFASAESLGWAYVGRFLIGAGCSFGWIGALTLIGIWFPPHRFALLSGLTSMLGMAGAIGGQAPLAAAVEAVGWRGTLFGAAAYGAVLATAIWFIVRDRRRPGMGEAAGTVSVGVIADLGTVVSNRQTWVLAILSATMGVFILAFASLWGVPYMMTAHGLTRTAAASAASMIYVGWAIGAPLLGWFSDRIQSRRIPLLIGTVVAYSSVLAVVYLPGVSVYGAFGLLLLSGFAGGTAIICYATARENNPPHASGATLGFVNMTTMAAGAVFQPVMGWLLDLNWDGEMVAGARLYSVEAYQIAFLVLLASGIVAVVSALLVRETRCRPVTVILDKDLAVR